MHNHVIDARSLAASPPLSYHKPGSGAGTEAERRAGMVYLVNDQESFKQVDEAPDAERGPVWRDESRVPLGNDASTTHHWVESRQTPG